MSQIDLVKDFEDSISSKELDSLNADVSEAVLDSILNDGLLKEIPAIKTAIGIYKVGQSFQFRNYIKKLYRFLYQTNKISAEEKEKFINKFERNQGSRKDLFERILYIIEKLDDVYKADVIGRLFVAMVKEKMNSDDFLRLCICVERIFINDLHYFNRTFNRYNTLSYDERKIIVFSVSDDVVKNNLLNLGLMNSKIKDDKRKAIFYERDNFYKTEIKLNRYGMLLSKFGFRVLLPEKRDKFDVDGVI